MTSFPTDSPPKPQPLDLLAVSPAAVDLINPNKVEPVQAMWQAFSKASSAIKNGKRLENVAWRLYSLHMIALKDNMEVPGQDTCSSSESLLSNPRHVSRDELRELLAPQPVIAGEYRPVQQTPSEYKHNTPSEYKHNTPSEYKHNTPSEYKPKLPDAHNEHRPDNEHRAGNEHNQHNEHRPGNEHNHRLPDNKHNHRLPGNKHSPDKHSPDKARPDKARPEPRAEHRAQHRAQHTLPGPQSDDKHRQESPASTARSPTSASGREQSPTSTSTSAYSVRSRCVRGFTPGSVSVANRSTPTLPPPSSAPASPPQSPAPAREPEFNKACVPRNSMFFIESSEDSDSEGGYAPLPAPPSEPWKSESARAKSIVKSAFRDGGHKKTNHVWFDNSMSDEPPSSYNDRDGSEWEDDDSEEEAGAMFLEKQVPLRPKLKPSLLSSLFLNKQLADAAATDRLADVAQREKYDEVFYDEDERPAESRESTPKAPTDVLLNAQIIGHIPCRESCHDRDDTLRAAEPEPRDEPTLRPSPVGATSLMQRPTFARSQTSDAYARPHRSDSLSLGAADYYDDFFHPLNYHARGW